MADAWVSTGAELLIEVNTEGDYLDGDMLPTPTTPTGEWDFWAIEWGYPYRGQPSVVFRIPVHVDAGFEASAAAPTHHTDIHGLTGELFAADDGAIADDPTGNPGSGADRLRSGPDGTRIRVRVTSRPCP